MAPVLVRLSVTWANRFGDDSVALQIPHSWRLCGNASPAVNESIYSDPAIVVETGHDFVLQTNCNLRALVRH